MSLLRTFLYVTFMALYACAVAAATCGIIYTAAWSVYAFGLFGLPIVCVCAGLAAVLGRAVARGP